MQKLEGAIFGALVVLAGCSTVPRSPAPHSSANPPPDWANGAVVTNQPSFAPVPPTQAHSLPRPVLPAPPADLAAPLPEPKWVSLNRWVESHGLGALRRVTAGPVESFALIAPRGVWRLNIGNLAARYDQLEIRLGFPPQLADGQVFVHALDLQKNIEPLLRGFVPETKSNRLVVIDPGHGGLNPGTPSATDERSEKFFTLDCARRLAPLLAANGWRVLLTRTNDVDVSLADRVAFAEKEGADLFVSLHFNSAGGNGREPSGLETFCLTPAGMTSSLTRGEEEDPSQSFPNNAFDEQNVRYAVRLHAAVLKANGQVDRGVRRARFLTVLRGQNRPAVLIEGGFLSNPAEARRIADPAFRQRLAEAVAGALQDEDRGWRIEDRNGPATAQPIPRR